MGLDTTLSQYGVDNGNNIMMCRLISHSSGMMKQKKTVTFATTSSSSSSSSSPLVHEVMSLKDYTVQEIEDSWYTQEDIADFKDDARAMAKYARREFRKLVASVDWAFNHAESISNQIEDDNDDDNGSRLSQNNKEMRHKMTVLATWCNHPEFRGVEKFASKVLRSTRDDYKEDVAQIVLTSKFRNPLEVAQDYDEMTMTSKTFAYMIGYADQLASLADRQRSMMYYTKLVDTEATKTTTTTTTRAGSNNNNNNCSNNVSNKFHHHHNHYSEQTTPFSVN